MLKVSLIYVHRWCCRQYWINYKYLKRKINEIIEHRSPDQPVVHSSDPKEIAKNAAEVEFFILIRKELKKTSEFFKRCQEEFTIRWERVWDSYLMLQEKGVVHDKNTWTRLLMACVRFYKDVLLLENFAIMNYCGFSKILKKHDKVTGYVVSYSSCVSMYFLILRCFLVYFTGISRGMPSCAT